MKSKKRITMPRELEGMIDRLNRLKLDRKAEAERLDTKATDYFKRYDLTTEDAKKNELNARQIQRAKNWRAKAIKLRGFEPATNRRIKHFSQKLAELRTGELPGLAGDGSVGL